MVGEPIEVARPAAEPKKEEPTGPAEIASPRGFRPPTTLEQLKRPPDLPVEPKPPIKRAFPSSMKTLLDEDGLRVALDEKTLLVELPEGYRAHVLAAHGGSALAPSLNRRPDALRAHGIVISVAGPGQAVGAYEGTIAGTVAAKKSAELFGNLHKQPADRPSDRPSVLQLLSHVALEGAAVAQTIVERVVARLEHGSGRR
jgi:hypothetical protein